MKRNKLFLILGILFIALGTGLAIHNLTVDKIAEVKSNEVIRTLNLDLIKAENLPKKEEVIEIPTKEIDGLDFIGVLSFPGLEKEMPVAASWDYDIIKTYPARFRGRTYNDPLIILAHYYKSQFANLSKLNTGDLIIFTDVYNRVIKYEVKLLEILDETEVERMTNTKYDLSLFTCDTDLSKRVTIRAMRIIE